MRNREELKIKFLKYLPWQEELFKFKYKFQVVSKGRRAGLTSGVACNMVEMSFLSGEPIKFLWFDESYGNIEQYYEDCFMPFLKQIPTRYYEFDKRKFTLRIFNAMVKFRSVTNPEGAEGFRYDYVFMNEAGIILRGEKGRYLWDNSVRPMMMDNANSVAIIGGKTRGMYDTDGSTCKFYDLSLLGQDDSYPDWKYYKISSYDNINIPKEQIDMMVSEYKNKSHQVLLQEIYGEFTETSTRRLIPESTIETAKQRYEENKQLLGEYSRDATRVMGVDFATKKDRCVISKRMGIFLLEPKIFNPEREEDWTFKFAYIIAEEYNKFRPTKIFIDEGYGGGLLIDILRRDYNIRCAMAINFGSQAFQSNRYFNKRAEIWDSLGIWLKDTGCLPPDMRELETDIAMIEERYKNDRLMLNSKNDMAVSPDVGDAYALLFSLPGLLDRSNINSGNRLVKSFKERTERQYNMLNHLHKKVSGHSKLTYLSKRGN